MSSTEGWNGQPYQQPHQQQPWPQQPWPQQRYQHPYQPPPRRGSHAKAWVALLAVLVAAGLVTGAFFVFRGGDSDTGGSPQEPVRLLADAVATRNVDELRGALCAARVGQADEIKRSATPAGVTIDVGAAHVNGNSGTVDVTTHYEGQVHPGSIPVVREDGRWKACPATVGDTESQQADGGGGTAAPASSTSVSRIPAFASGRCAHATSTRGATDAFLALATSGQDAAAIHCATGTVAPASSIASIVLQLHGRHFTYSRALTASTSVYTGADGSTLFVGAISRAPYGYLITDVSFQ